MSNLENKFKSQKILYNPKINIKKQLLILHNHKKLNNIVIDNKNNMVIINQNSNVMTNQNNIFIDNKNIVMSNKNNTVMSNKNNIFIDNNTVISNILIDNIVIDNKNIVMSNKNNTVVSNKNNTVVSNKNNTVMSNKNNTVMSNKNNTVIDNTVIDNTVIDNTVIDNTVIDNTVIDNTIIDNTIIDNKNIVMINKNNTVMNNKNNTVIDNTIIDNIVIDNKNIDNRNIFMRNKNNIVIDNKNTDIYYLSKLAVFYKIYNVDNINDPKIEHRYFCFRYLNYIRNIELCDIKLNQSKEAVLIEFRIFPHIEFLIRNTINKLDDEWSHTIICGNLNYYFMLNLCNSISNNIKVIKLDYDNMTQSEYSNYLCTLNFWNLLYGEKILIYQEDTNIFKNNINDFLEWDYIGAPWHKTQNDTPNLVGNGGFSLRTKQCMIDVINKISLKNTKFNSSTTNFMKNVGLMFGPEDVYFSKNMQEFKIGKVADYNSALKFSTESICNPNSLGGHCFWYNDKNWKQRLYNNIIIQFKPTYKIDMLEHRGGWKSVINNLISKDFFNDNSNINFFDMIETNFLWDTNYICNNYWAGIIHCTQNTPTYLEVVNIQNLFKNINFINSLKKCKFIISLSKYVTNFLQRKFSQINIEINIHTINHPVENKNIPLFDINKYNVNKNKLLIQIGQQLRKITSIYLIKINKKYKKLWLTGTKDFNKCIDLLNKEIKYLNIINLNINEVPMKYTKTFEEYDELLSENIVFIDLFDAAANNTILECIVRKTPIILNKVGGVTEYLGDDYPLYFTELSEVNNLLTDNNILKAHEYLKNLETTDINTFNKNIFNLVNKYKFI